MASFMFLGFLTQQKQHYEERVHEGNDEGPRLREVWKDMETRCWEKYLDEVDDDQRGTHPYIMLKHE
ncbi:unnamed protein product, partial [Prorocentrum cordatum]